MGRDRGGKGGVVWDEDNLIYNESHKSATMKIDEPPTPYNKDYDSGTEDDDEESTSSEKETKSTTQVRERGGIKTEDDSKRAHFIDEVSTALEESKRKPARRPRFSSDEDTTEDDEALDGKSA